MNKKHRILIVDDSPDDINFVMESLPEEYAVMAAVTGDKAIELSKKSPAPDAIVLDVEMPGLDGYETCREIKRNPETADIDIIFLSAHDTVEEKLAGYDAGATDYLIKPIQPELLQQKVRLALDNRKEKVDFSQKISSTHKIAMMAMTNAGELGVVLESLTKLVDAFDLNSLAQVLIDACARYGLESGVLLKGPIGTIFSGSKPLASLEQELLSRSQGGPRITELGSRLILNSSGISLLIKNLPEDAELKGRLRDHLGTLLNGAEAQLRVLFSQEAMKVLLVNTNSALDSYGKCRKRRRESWVSSMDAIVKELESAFMTCGFTEEQEKLILKIVHSGVDSSLDDLDAQESLDQQLNAIAGGLNRIVGEYRSSSSY